MNNYCFKSFAKINLLLKILNKRSDNYHNIYSIFLELNYFDVIYIKPSNCFQLTCEGIAVPCDETNLIYKAYQLISSKYKIKEKVSIRIKKNIPIFSGLGGGSSNAACTLSALNKIWNLKIDNNELKNLGIKIGADVPFFINGGLQEVQGIGDSVKQLSFNNKDTFFILLIIPKIKISTKWAYENVNKYLHSNKKLYKFRGSLKEFEWQLYENDFEELVISAYPEIGKIKRSLFETGAFFASLSGSGSTVFGVYRNLNSVKEAENYFSSYQTILTTPNMINTPFGA